MTVALMNPLRIVNYSLRPLIKTLIGLPPKRKPAPRVSRRLRVLFELLVIVTICSGAVLAQHWEMAPFFQGDALPLPPQQNAKWEHGDDALSQAAALLFEQGLANPAGLESRQTPWTRTLRSWKSS